MSAELWLAAGSALWIGLLTAISPCPLATNVAAISFIGRRVASPRSALWTGLLYAAGRSLAYMALAGALVAGLLSAPALSQFLQRQFNRLLGPILILVGMFLLGLIRIGGGGSGITESVGRRVQGWGVWAGLALGAVFALSFCPASAALYFGGLIPMAVRFRSTLFLPLVYGAGTALPVVLFAVLLVFSTRAMARTFERITVFERWARRVTGGLFVLLGIYFTLAYAFRVL